MNRLRIFLFFFNFFSSLLSKNCQMWMSSPMILISALWMQRRANLYVFKTILIYIASSGLARAI